MFQVNGQIDEREGETIVSASENGNEPNEGAVLFLQISILDPESNFHFLQTLPFQFQL